MPFTVTMPKLSPTMDEGTIVKWHKKEGDFVEAGDVLIEVATDKATVEYAALDEGFLRRVLIPEGATAAVNDAIALFSATKDEPIEEPAPKKKAEKVAVKSASKKEAQQEVSSKTVSRPVFVPEEPPPAYAFSQPRGGIGERVLASPLAKNLAKQRGIDITTVKGSGPNERIMSRDLDLGQPAADVSFGSRELPAEPAGSYREEALTPIRKSIATRLADAKASVPHFYVEKEIDARPLVALRAQLKEMGIKLSVNDLVVRATALALRRHPDINSGFNSETQSLIRFQTIDISVAVSLPSGLITPIIRHADYKNVGEIAVEIKALTARAKEGKLESHEYRGGSFTVSNLGMHGVDRFFAIINPPQAAILAVSAIHDKPIVESGQLIAGQTMALALSLDHRVVDGVAGALFLKTLQTYLENPAILLVN